MGNQTANSQAAGGAAASTVGGTGSGGTTNSGAANAGTAASGTQTANTTGAGSASAGTATAGAAPSGTATTGTAASGTMAGGTSGTAAPPATAGGTPVQASADGAKVYSTNCASCHGAAGAGVAGAFPALAGDQAILGSDIYVSDVLLYGLQGQIQAGGQTYNGVMPAWAGTLTDAEIAAVLTHIRSSWGNTASAVAEATVKTERGTPKTVAQVLAERPQ